MEALKKVFKYEFFVPNNEFPIVIFERISGKSGKKCRNRNKNFVRQSKLIPTKKNNRKVNARILLFFVLINLSRQGIVIELNSRLE